MSLSWVTISLSMGTGSRGRERTHHIGEGRTHVSDGKLVHTNPTLCLVHNLQIKRGLDTHVWKLLRRDW